MRLVGIEVGCVGLAKLRQDDLVGSDKEFAVGRQWGALSSGVI